MEWSRTKSILIFVLLVIDIFLYYNLERTKAQKFDLPEEYVRDAVAALEKRGVTVEEGAMPNRRISLPVAEIDSKELLYPVARAALGDDTLQPEVGEEGIRFSNDAGEFILLTDTDFTFKPFGEKPDFGNILKIAGYDKHSYQEDTAGGIRILIGGVKVEGCGVTYEDGVYTGTLINPQQATLKYVGLIDPVNALLNFADYADKAGLGAQAVTSVESIYALEQEGLFKVLTAEPAYKITSNKTAYLVAAVSGEVKIYVNS
ncbi:hypothetical protein SDC9_56221 [bioreactor metagenome]|uniref:Regulatory protein YycH-like domain-containing protein n=1 Tax=bioreactor metagenome TaxID=1076179 RepID=A0A644X294_9ZZZZ